MHIYIFHKVQRYQYVFNDEPYRGLYFQRDWITNSQNRIQFTTSALRMVSDLLPEPLRLACILNIDYNTSH